MFFIIKVGYCQKKKLILFVQESSISGAKNLFHSCKNCKNCKNGVPIPYLCSSFTDIFNIHNSDYWNSYLFLDED